MVRTMRLWPGIIIFLLLAALTLYPVNSEVSGQDELPTVIVIASETLRSTQDLSQPTLVIETAAPTITPSPTEIPVISTVEETFAVPTDPIVTKRLLVRTTRNYSSESMMANGAKFVFDAAAIELAKIGVVIMDVPIDRIDQIKKELKADTEVIFVESDGEVHALDVFPSDPGFAFQYGLINIHAPQGWEISTGSPSVTIAVVDSGVDAFHPDLVLKVLPGIDFIDGDNIPQDEYGHGTHVSGIAAASSNNGLGVTGASWGAQILPVRVLDAAGDGNYANLSAGIIWSVDNGAQIINLSLGGLFPNDTLKTAIDYAVNNGVLVIAAAGNDGSGNLRYPARYPAVIAVGSTNSFNQRSGFSNHGTGLDLVAPGEAIYSTNPSGRYGNRTGTSMSAPFVSGLAAILWGMPGMPGPQRVESIIEHSALDLGVPGWDAEFGFGLIQMDAALQTRINPPRQKSPTPQYAYGYGVSWTPTATASATSTITPTKQISPSITNSAPRINLEITNTITYYVDSTTPFPLDEVTASENTQQDPQRSGLLLTSGLCLLLGGIALVLLLFVTRKRRQ